MSHHALLEYIHKAKQYDASDQEIAERLHESGWYRVDVQDALELYRRIAPSAELASSPVVSSKVSVTKRAIPHVSDLNVITVASFAFAIGFIGYLWLGH